MRLVKFENKRMINLGAGRITGFIIFLSRCKSSMMKKLTILLLIVELFVACNNSSNTSSNTETVDSQQQKKDDTVTIKKEEEKSRDSTAGYTWSQAEQNRFLKDCARESEENIKKGKLKDFCQCMLTEAQRYYPSYKTMDQKSDEDNDGEIFKKCLEAYGEDSDDE
jgi:hypothetical protein